MVLSLLLFLLLYLFFLILLSFFSFFSFFSLANIFFFCSCLIVISHLFSQISLCNFLTILYIMSQIILLVFLSLFVIFVILSLRFCGMIPFIKSMNVILSFFFSSNHIFLNSLLCKLFALFDLLLLSL